VWSDFDAVLETVEEVLNHDEYYNRIYGDFGKLNAILDKMENDGYDNLSRKIKNWWKPRVVKLIVLLKCTYNTNRDLSRTIVICRL
jgi:hypothetical protein